MVNAFRFLDPNSMAGSHTTQIKVCGITRVEDALHAARCGAGAVGLIFYSPSGRNLTGAQAKAIRECLPPDVASVAVVVNPADELLEEIVHDVRPNFIQFHGNEPEPRCCEAGLPFIKAFRVRSSEQVTQGIEAYPKARGFLLDAYEKDKVGGTGRTFSWEFVPHAEKPIILAGGLHSGNISQAIHQVKPTAVDVSTGVEISEGIKNHAAISEFVAAVQAADEAMAESETVS